MKILIADDEPVAREILREHVEAIPNVQLVGEAASGPDTISQISALHPDLVLLDLQMPGLDGLSVVRSLKGDRVPLIIVVTAYDEHALAAFEVGAVDYLLKPVRRERLIRAIEKARRQLGLVPASRPAVDRPAAPRKVVVRRGSDLYLLDPAEIVAFQSDGDLVHAIAADQRYLCDHSLKVLEKKLESPQFRRIHRRTIINTDHIRKISPLSSKRWLVKMSNGFEAVVSKRLARAIREQTRW